MLGICSTISVQNMIRDIFLPIFPSRKAKTLEKPTFFDIAKMKRSARAPKPCKTQCFSNFTHARNPVNYVDISDPVVPPFFVTRVGGLGGASVYNLRLPPTASGEDTGAWPAPGFKGLRLTAGRRPTWVCVGLGRVHVKLSGAYWALGGGKSKVKLSGAHLGPRLGQVGPM